MKTKSIVLALISTVAIATLSFTYVSTKKSDAKTSSATRTYTSEPAGGLAVDDRL